MDEKTISLAKKLKALAERGIGGEKTTAQKKLKELLEKNGIESLEELIEDKVEYFMFSYNGIYERKLLAQCMYKVVGDTAAMEFYKPVGKRQKIGFYCTKAQKLEIELEFEFYKNVFAEEMKKFVSAFISAQGIYPDNAPVADKGNLTKEDIEIMFMAKGIKKKTRALLIE